MALVIASGPAAACERDPYLFTLPGETETQALERARRIDADQAIARRFNRESYDFENAARIYVARVVSQDGSEPAEEKRSPPATVVRPLEPLKGEEPTNDRTLIDDGGSGRCEDYGDGFGAHANADSLVVVFEGLPITAERPRGVDSFQIEDIRTVPLLYKLMGLFGPELQ